MPGVLMHCTQMMLQATQGEGWVRPVLDCDCRPVVSSPIVSVQYCRPRTAGRSRSGGRTQSWWCSPGLSSSPSPPPPPPPPPPTPLLPQPLSSSPSTSAGSTGILLRTCRSSSNISITSLPVIVLIVLTHYRDYPPDFVQLVRWLKIVFLKCTGKHLKCFSMVTFLPITSHIWDCFNGL